MTPEIIIGNEYTYCGKDKCVVLEIDKTHVLIQFENGGKIATPHSSLDPNYGKINASN